MSAEYSSEGFRVFGAGIDSGDLVLIRQQSTAEPGQIVVALIGDEEATLKRFYPDYENGIIRLHPENPLLEDIYADTCIIQCVAGGHRCGQLPDPGRGGAGAEKPGVTERRHG